jgi:hypothetical protein
VLALAVLAAVPLPGCGAVERGERVPPALTEKPVTPGAPNFRYRPVAAVPEIERTTASEARREKAGARRASRSMSIAPELHFGLRTRPEQHHALLLRFYYAQILSTVGAEFRRLFECGFSHSKAVPIAAHLRQ